MRQWMRTGAPWRWLSAGAVAVSLIAVFGLLCLIGWRGLSYFWPAPVYQFEIEQNGVVQVVIGEVYQVQTVPSVRSQDSRPHRQKRLLVKIGNREIFKRDFININQDQILSKHTPIALAEIERSQNGTFYGFPEALMVNDVLLPKKSLNEDLALTMSRNEALREQIEALQQEQIASINHELESLRLEQRRLTLAGEQGGMIWRQNEIKRESLKRRYQALVAELNVLNRALHESQLLVRDMRGQLVPIAMADVLSLWYPNHMSTWQKWQHWGKQALRFISENPREANTEGGVYPAIFGTVFMVLLMTVLVTPLGVISAIYLHEYAGKNLLTRMIRVAVINLAGVPSIVYGVFGLGFFVYFVGGNIDKLFYPEALPAPTFGAPGVLWSAFTLALLTMPVVIVSTEEGLSRIPSALRNGSLALGATKAETIWRIVLPMATPAIMTGLILAVARAAGEVAPLMLVGVVKMAQSLPVDSYFPYVHLDRKFMHLGFHIYDLGFQSPNVETTRPLVYASAFLLVTVIVSLNLVAIGLRNRLRDKYHAWQHD
ncbi:hypothetical protein VST7929_00682 [Vibrio stylophorae]|uniref:Phosphate transport system permease protein PstA n=1 Tax=Vibrio stylophorae TaxID=659351 RepID=A0ABM8ZRA7_9VIBR|nr:phosphate ABC transporter permease PstA [Vibrio stylophorae]CAH0532835.1 hypothetical protein VST7929_00682 [Vibrio stylophorae]